MILLATVVLGLGLATESAIDKLVREASQTAPASGTAGSLWTPGATLGDLAMDLRPRRVNDLVTIVVLDRASAIARGTTKSSRAAEASGGVDSIFGTPPGGSRLPRMLNLGGSSSLEGQGETSRETVLRTTLSARVTHVLPNGVLVVEGRKSVRVNSEVQTCAVSCARSM
jgi:flagellar L-ring protein FlgH